MYLTVKAHYHHVNGEVRVEREHLDVPSQVKTVSDLKSLIQAKMRIPADDMSLTYQGFLLIDNRQLDSLYIHHGDEVVIENARQTDLQHINDIVSSIFTLEHFLDRNINVLLVDSSPTMKPSPVRTELGFLLAAICDDLVLMREVIMPWKTTRTANNRKYMFRIGGTRRLVKVFNMIRQIQYKEILNLTEEEMSLIIQFRGQCLEILWNISELKCDREAVLRCGALDMAVQSFLDQVPDVYSSCQILSDRCQVLNETSVGSIVQFAEFEQIRVQLAYQGLFLKTLIDRLCQLTISNKAREREYNLYNQQVICNTVSCIASSPSTHKAFVTNGHHRTLLYLSEHMQSDRLQFDVSAQQLPSRYFLALSLANILAYSPHLLQPCQNSRQLSAQSQAEARARSWACLLPCGDSGTKKEVCFAFHTDWVLIKFLSDYLPSEVSDWEQQHSYVWVTMSPFIELAWSWRSSGCCRLTSKSSSNTILLSNTHTSRWSGTLNLPQALGVFCVEHVLADTDNIATLYSEGIDDFVIILCWWLDHLQKNMRIFWEQHKNPPSLENICRAHLMVQGKLTPQAAFHVPAEHLTAHLS